MSVSRRHRPGLISDGRTFPVVPPLLQETPGTHHLQEAPGSEPAEAPQEAFLLERLRSLTDLRERRLLTDAEFAAATAQLVR